MVRLDVTVGCDYSRSPMSIEARVTLACALALLPACPNPVDPADSSSTGSDSSDSSDSGGETVDTSSGTSESDGSSSESSSTETGSESSESTSDSGESSSDSTTETSSTDGSDTGETTGGIDEMCPPPDTDQFSFEFTGFVFGEQELPFDSTACDYGFMPPMSLGDWAGPEEVYFFSCEDSVEFGGTFHLPNNNWSPILSLEPGYCYELRFYTEPTGPDTCRVARLDFFDPEQPGVPVYSVASTREHLVGEGLVVEAIDPAPCEGGCDELGLRFTAGGNSLDIAADEFPWTTLDAGAFDLQIFSSDAYAFASVEGEGCVEFDAVELAGWAARRVP